MLSVAVALLLTSGWSCEEEDRRITNHLRGALAQLESSPPADLNDAQRAARHDALMVLGRYIDAGRFPRWSGAGFVPVFVDAAGTRCAMGEVLFQTGAAHLVNRVHESANEATIGQLSDDGELKARLEAIGFTLEEAALVQPTYRWCSPMRALWLCGHDGLDSSPPPNVAIYVMDGGAAEPTQVLKGQPWPLELVGNAWSAPLPDGTRLMIGSRRDDARRVFVGRGDGWIAWSDALCDEPLSLSDADARHLVELQPLACLQSLAAIDGRWLLMACGSISAPYSRPGDLQERESFCRADGSFRQEIVQPRRVFDDWLKRVDAGLPEDVYDVNLAPVELPAASVEMFRAGCHTGAASPATAAAALLVTLRLHRRLRRRHDDR
ncbi:MAG: hypothetical protein Q8N26_18570 [Myxococcales bacterium]|nr:hypothetical protein [Myxococcales bacterium]